MFVGAGRGGGGLYVLVVFVIVICFDERVFGDWMCTSGVFVICVERVGEL